MKDKPVVSKQICKEAQEFLKNVIAVMDSNGVLTSMDFEAVELLGITYHNWHTAQQVILSEGQYFKTKSGDLKTHPCVKIALDEKIQLTKLFESLGLTPKARKEISKSSEKRKELSPMDMFLHNQNKDGSNV